MFRHAVCFDRCSSCRRTDGDSRSQTSTNGYSSRRATAIGRRAARIAGAGRQSLPSPARKLKPLSSSPGVIWNANARLRKRLPVHRAGREPVQPQHSHAADHSADERNQQCLESRTKRPRWPAKPQRAHRRNFATTLGHRGIHGVERAENRANRHDRSHQAAEHGDQASSSPWIASRNNPLRGSLRHSVAGRRSPNP